MGWAEEGAGHGWCLGVEKGDTHVGAHIWAAQLNTNMKAEGVEHKTHHLVEEGTRHMDAEEAAGMNGALEGLHWWCGVPSWFAVAMAVQNLGAGVGSRSECRCRFGCRGAPPQGGRVVAAAAAATVVVVVDLAQVGTTPQGCWQEPPPTVSQAGQLLREAPYAASSCRSSSSQGEVVVSPGGHRAIFYTIEEMWASAHQVKL